MNQRLTDMGFSQAANQNANDADQPEVEYLHRCWYCKSPESERSLSVYDRRCMNCFKDNPFFEKLHNPPTEFHWFCINNDCQSINILPMTKCRNCNTYSSKAAELKTRLAEQRQKELSRRDEHLFHWQCIFCKKFNDKILHCDSC